MMPRGATDSFEKERDALRALVLRSLKAQGHNVARPVPPTITSKEQLRALPAPSVVHRIERAAGELRRYRRVAVGPFVVYAPPT